MKMFYPPKKDIEYPPGKKRMAPFDKTPVFNQEKIVRRTKQLSDIRGPELFQNRVLYGKFGLQVEYGCFLYWGHLQMIRNTVTHWQTDKMFSYWRIEQPWRPMTKKPDNVRMGGGKGAVKNYSYPVKAGRIIFEIGGDCNYIDVKKMMKQVTCRMPAKSRIVTNKMLDKEVRKEEYLAERNANPFDFVECVMDNTMGIKILTSPYDVIWKGKYR